MSVPERFASCASLPEASPALDPLEAVPFSTCQDGDVLPRPILLPWRFSLLMHGGVPDGELSGRLSIPGEAVRGR